MRKVILALCALIAMTAAANDSEFTLAGNQLVPMKSADISVAKEVLTITLPDFVFAPCTHPTARHVKVDVYYEFYNSGPARTVTVGFVADPSSMAEGPAPADGAHPDISKFQVVMNGVKLPWRSSISRGATEYDYTHVYSFKARFKHGKNIVRHTYEYNSSNGNCPRYWVDYKLTPAARWKGGKIADFTLRVVAPKANNVVIETKPFVGLPPKIKGTGKYRDISLKYDEDGRVEPVMELSLRHATAEWHLTDYTPTEELCIISGDVISTAYVGRYCYKDGRLIEGYQSFENPYFLYWSQNPEAERMERNLSYGANGYVFRDPKLNNYFRSMWWYMPAKGVAPKPSAK